jgi:cytochrome P450
MAGIGRFESDVAAAISGTIWALLTHPGQFALVREGKAKWA